MDGSSDFRGLDDQSMWRCISLNVSRTRRSDFNTLTSRYDTGRPWLYTVHVSTPSRIHLVKYRGRGQSRARGSSQKKGVTTDPPTPPRK